MKITDLAHNEISKYLKENSLCVDATFGNANDTYFLTKHSLKVCAFDIQTKAIESGKAFLESKNALSNVSIFKESHSEMQEFLPDDFIGKTDIIMFNLGYLPRGDKSITTKPKTTIKAFNESKKILKKDALLSVIFYYGQENGLEETLVGLKFLEENFELIYPDVFPKPMPNNQPVFVLCKNSKGQV